MVNVKWIEALESGEYKQGYEQLYDDGRYCCLGVGELLYAQTHNTPPIYHASGLPLPDCIKWLGIDEKLAKKLALLNDSKGKTFKEIATYLRSLND